MKNGFYFTNNQILSDYFLLQKMRLIQVHEVDSTEAASPSFFIMNGLKMTFSAVFESNENAESTLIFNSVSENELIGLSERVLRDNKHKVIFIAHVLYDYHSELIRLLKYVDISNILFFVDNSKDQFLISEQQINDLNVVKTNPDQFLYFYKSKQNDYKISFSYTAKTFLFQIYYMVLKLLLKPQQSVKDFYATYNFTFFYGKLKMFIINCAYRVRHFSVMSVIRSFYSIKVFLIRSAYFIHAKCIYCVNKIFYSIRHLSVMFFITLFYSMKVLLIRAAYFTYEKMYLFFNKLFYFSRHLFVMSLIKLISFVHYAKGLFIWILYRIQWVIYGIQWVFFRLNEFNMNYTFYPIRKFYWFFVFQYNTRILKKNR